MPAPPNYLVAEVVGEGVRAEHLEAPAEVELGIDSRSHVRVHYAQQHRDRVVRHRPWGNRKMHQRHEITVSDNHGNRQNDDDEEEEEEDDDDDDDDDDDVTGCLSCRASPVPLMVTSLPLCRKALTPRRFE
jgi:hypothetical protein